MARLTIVYHRDGTKTVGGKPSTVHFSDSERLAIEGTQGERVLRGYRDLESAGRFRRRDKTESPSRIKQAWGDELTGRFN